jgi:PAS domain S-box-containing protein
MYSDQEILNLNTVDPALLEEVKSVINNSGHRDFMKVLGRENSSYYEEIFNTTPEAILILDDNGRIVKVNRGFEKLFQFPASEILGKNIDEKIIPGYLLKESDEILQNIKRGKEIYKDTIRNKKDGRPVDVLVFGSKITLPDGTPGIYLVLIDISRHKRSEEQIRASLLEKEVLIKEIHHRVKNNLQVVSSLLYLQSKKIKDKEVENMFVECQNRVKSISLIHEKLYQTNDLTRIDFEKYLRSLVHHLFKSFGLKNSSITPRIKAENVFLTMDTAIPCGLIINELVTNSLKHAFPSSKKGEISIEVTYQADNKFILIVRDNGVGIPEEINIHNTETLGFLLVQSLVRQIEGNLELKRGGGTEFRITFSILNYMGGCN